jgi:hypothetical protein
LADALSPFFLPPAAAALAPPRATFAPRVFLSPRVVVLVVDALAPRFVLPLLVPPRVALPFRLPPRPPRAPRVDTAAAAPRPRTAPPRPLSNTTESEGAATAEQVVR